ncbi:hypothetical protein BpHYR1_004774, partial [Brachionus plicatilis]
MHFSNRVLSSDCALENILDEQSTRNKVLSLVRKFFLSYACLSSQKILMVEMIKKIVIDKSCPNRTVVNCIRHLEEFQTLLAERYIIVLTQGFWFLQSIFSFYGFLLMLNSYRCLTGCEVHFNSIFSIQKNLNNFFAKRDNCEERVVVTSSLSNVSVRIENRKGENSKNHFCRKLILVYI